MVGIPSVCLPAVRSVVTGLEWPALPEPDGQTMLTLQFQLHHSQSWDSERVAEHQLRQLRELAAHAVANVPFYRDHLRRARIFSLGGLTSTSFLRWPLLERADLLGPGGHHLRARRMPAEHGGIVWNSTTGSTGKPVRVANSMLGAFMHAAMVVRSHLWYGLDHASTLAAIRRTAEGQHDDWGSASRLAFTTGPMVVLDLAKDIRQQLDWLVGVKPAYLLSTGNNLRSLILESQAAGKRPVGLKALMSFADRPPSDLAKLARTHWDVPVFDTYSAGEFGPLALQCPDHQVLHAQSENHFIEILREDGTACEPGEIGKVVVTDLHNFAMPLIRYALGDHAEAAPPCPCGRGLKAIRGVVGRSANMAVDPQGRRFWPLLNPDMWIDTPVLQRQFIQHSPALIEVRYVAASELTPTLVASLEARLRSTLRYPFEFRFAKVHAIALGPGGKFEEFISKIAPAGMADA